MKIIKSKRYYKRARKSLPYNKKGGSSNNCMYNPNTQKMESQCPGLKYLNEIRGTVIDQDPNSVYMAFGHGCDLEYEELTVPPGCEYYTATACGKASKHNKKLSEDFFINTIDLSNPEKYDFIDDAVADDSDELVLFTGEFSLYKRNSGDSYVNNKNSTILGMGCYGGLRKMGDIIINNLYIDSIIQFPTFVILSSPSAKSKDIIRPYTLEFYYLHHFAGSIFPTTLQVCKLLHQNYTENELNSFKYTLYGSEHVKFLDLIKNNFSIDYASIMEVFKGRHINFACRPICRGPNTVEQIIPTSDFVALRRSKSASLPIQWNNDI